MICKRFRTTGTNYIIDTETKLAFHPTNANLVADFASLLNWYQECLDKSEEQEAEIMAQIDGEFWDSENS